MTPRCIRNPRPRRTPAHNREYVRPVFPAAPSLWQRFCTWLGIGGET